MNVTDIIVKKKELQEAFVKQIQEFEATTKLEIINVDMNRSYMFGPGENGYVLDINIEVKLP